MQGNKHLCFLLLRPLLESVAEYQVPFVNAAGERRLTRIFHDIEVHDLQHGTASSSDAPAWFAGVDDSGVEAVVHFRFNKCAILSLLEDGFIEHQHVIEPGDPPRIRRWVM